MPRSMFPKFQSNNHFNSKDRLIDRERIAIFIDADNWLYGAFYLGIELDYIKLLTYLKSNSKLLRAFFYIGVDANNKKQSDFLLWMCARGYRVISKDFNCLSDGSKTVNFTVEIAVDLITLAEFYDTAVVVSGDSNLIYAINQVSYLGARVEIVSLRAMTSDSLINVADRYTDLADIKEDIAKSEVDNNFSLYYDRF